MRRLLNSGAFARLQEYLPYIAALLPGLVAIPFYLNSLGNQLLWDDLLYIAYDPFVRDPKNLFVLLNPANLWYVVPVANASRPVWLASVIIDMASSGGNVPQMRLTSILLNGFNASLVYCAALLLCSRPRAALISALLFALHPLHTEAVDILSFRTHILALTFTLSALIFRLLARDARDYRYLNVAYNALSALSLLLGALSHEIAIVAVPILALYERLPIRHAPLARAPDRASTSKLPYAWLTLLALLLVGYSAYRLPRSGYDIGNTKDTLAPLSEGISAHGMMPPIKTPLQDENISQRIIQPGNPPWHEVYESRYLNFLTMSRVLGNYLLKLFVPYPLQADYNPRIQHSPFSPGVWLSWLGWLGLALLCWRFRARSVLIPAGFIWLAVSMLPLTNAIRLFNIQAERYLYLPSAGFCLMAGGFLEIWLKKLRRPRLALALVLTPVLCAFAAITFQRNKDYRDPQSFFGSVLKADPDVPRALNNLAYYHIALKQPEQAVSLLERSLSVYPLGAEARNSLAALYLKNSDTASALSTLQPLLADKTSLTLGTAHLHAVITGESGQPQRAVALLEQYLERWPSNPHLLSSLANYSLQLRKPQAFLRAIQNTDMRHTTESVKCYAAMAYLQAGMRDDANETLDYMTPDKRSACRAKIRRDRPGK